MQVLKAGGAKQDKNQTVKNRSGLGYLGGPYNQGDKNVWKHASDEEAAGGGT